MSAFMVSKSHIDYLVHAAMRLNAHPRLNDIRFNGEYVSAATSNNVGRALWFTNAASINARYPGTFDTGKWGVDRESLMTYSCPVWPTRPFDPVVALKALDCYEYQSSEHEGWKHSEAFAFCDRLRGALIGALPGYDQAPWEIDSDTVLAAA